MSTLMLSIHLTGTLLTAVVVTIQRHQEREAQGRLMLLGLTMVVLALMAWPVMLGVAARQWYRNQQQFR